jgi:hypothetical protein
MMGGSANLRSNAVATRWIALAIAAALLLARALAWASPSDEIAAALRDARAWVDCIRAFDARCVANGTDSEYLKNVGTTTELFAKSESYLYNSLKAAGGKVTRFDLTPPREVFSLDGREYVFIPYDQMFDTNDRHAQSSSYLIGASNDKGATWQFIDGSTITRGDIRLLMPRYRGEPPLPPSYASASNDGEAAGYRELLTGFNGPSLGRIYRYGSADEVRASWVARALGADLDQVLAHVDFEREILIAAAAGGRLTANGPVSVIRIDVDNSVVKPYLEIGVNAPGCEQAASSSYPFVLVVMGRPKKNAGVAGIAPQDFPNGCARAVSGVAHD